MYERRDWDDSRSGLLVAIVTEKLHAAQWHENKGPVLRIAQHNQRPGLDDLVLRAGNLADRHRHALATYEQALAQGGGLPLTHIDLVLSEAKPPPRTVEDDDDFHVFINAEFKRIMAGLHVVPAAMRPLESQRLTPRDLEVIDALVKRLRPNIERLHEDLRVRLVRAPEPTPRYGKRLERWIRSAPGQLFVLPLVGAAVVQLVKGEAKGLLPLIVIALGFALLPPTAPIAAWPRASLTLFTGGFIVLTTGFVVIATATSGLGAALLTFAAAATAFGLGARSGVARTD
jgi:hypothetical protein